MRHLKKSKKAAIKFMKSYYGTSPDNDTYVDIFTRLIESDGLYGCDVEEEDSVSYEYDYDVIAKNVYEIENASGYVWEEWYEIYDGHPRWRITERIYMEQSKDMMCYYLWSLDEGKQEYCRCKILPAFSYSQEDIKKILMAQSWVFV